MQFSGKLQGRRETEELNSLPVGGILIYLQDVLSNRDFLVDTGASRSLFPHQSSAVPTGPRLLMADGRPTKAWGSRTLPLQFGNRRFQFSFLLADVDRPILGADFLAEFDLLVDSSRRQVLDRDSMQPLANPSSTTADPAIALIFKLAPDVASLLKEFPDASCLPASGEYGAILWGPRTTAWRALG